MHASDDDDNDEQKRPPQHEDDINNGSQPVPAARGRRRQRGQPMLHVGQQRDEQARVAMGSICLVSLSFIFLFLCY